MNRRDLLGRLMAGGAAAAPAVIMEAVDSLSLAAGDRRLSNLLAHTPPETAVRCLLDVAADGRASVADFAAALARERNRATRRRAAANRRERHAGNETLYAGPVSIAGLTLPTRECRSAYRRAVLVGTADRDYTIHGVIDAVDEVILRDDVGGHAIAVAHVKRRRCVEVPRGSRVLVVTRDGLHAVMQAEVVRTADGRVRLHIYPRRSAVAGDTVPEIRGAVAFDSGEQRVVGLLGLPL